jgi:hypothetical protein
MMRITIIIMTIVIMSVSWDDRDMGCFVISGNAAQQPHWSQPVSSLTVAGRRREGSESGDRALYTRPPGSLISLDFLSLHQEQLAGYSFV